MKAHFLLEIGSEEIPASYLQPALDQLSQSLDSLFKTNRLTFQTVRTALTPRRLSICFEDLDLQQEDSEQIVTGPNVNMAFKDGVPGPAAIGFAKSRGLQPEDIFTVQKGNAEFIAVKLSLKGKSAGQILSEALPGIILGLNFPKTMKWMSDSVRFARPLRWIVAILGQELVPFSIGNLVSGKVSMGHRVLSLEPQINLSSASWVDYIAKLRYNGVIADPAERKKIILEMIREEQLRFHAGFQTDQIDEDLLDEVTNICEFPSIGVGSFDEKFLQVPQEVLITSMAHHQKYFPVLQEGGILSNHFLFIFNNKKEHEAVIRKGNEKVLRARLEDAFFFYREDQKTPLEQRVEKLKGMIYQKELGTYYDKVQRLSVIAAKVASLADLNLVDIEKAAHLTKADLDTHMVYEFPELQGVIGRVYALRQGLTPEIAYAIEDHYAPRFQKDAIPRNSLGIALAVAEKIDNLISIIGIGKAPSGSKDPFALRRAAIGLARIILESKLDFDLRMLFDTVFQALPALKLKSADLFEQVFSFIDQRVKVYLSQEAGYRQDYVESVFDPSCSCYYDNLLKLSALRTYGNEPDFQDLVVTFKRVGNIVSQAKGKYPDQNFDTVVPRLLQDQAEKELADALQSVGSELEKASLAKDYLSALRLFSSLRPQVDRFFDAVMVMAEDENIRNNRLSILNQINQLLGAVADFTRIQGLKAEA